MENRKTTTWMIAILLFAWGCGENGKDVKERSGYNVSSMPMQEKKSFPETNGKTKVEEKRDDMLPKEVFRSPLIGRWYPENETQLREQIKGFFDKADVDPMEGVIALILPHAGYRYSGQTAAWGLKCLPKKYKRIVILGPSHRIPLTDVIEVSRATHYLTPLGEVPVDVEFVKRLKRHRMFVSHPMVDPHEHSVQIEIPLLQYCQEGASLVPLVAGQCSPETIKKAAAILKGMMDSETLLVVSSDFIHYGPSFDYVPFKTDVPEGIRKLNAQALKFIEALDRKGFMEYCEKTGATICGQVPIAVMIEMLPEKAKGKLVHEESSGNLMKDFSNSVSYLSIVFTGAWKEEPEVKPEEIKEYLSKEDQKTLLTLARGALVYYLKHDKVPDFSDLGVEVASERLKEPAATFVTLRKKEDLRGCIGELFPTQPLYKSVISNAIKSGVSDYRFNPMTIEECDEVTIKISVLTVPKPVASEKEIRIGTDGIILRKSGRSAVFLPEVATEQGWDLPETLSYLSRKAGLSSNAWEKDAQFEVFQSIAFGEGE